jgi:hypothetical protein
MTVQQAIEHLAQILAKYGNVEVLFDCQYCGKATRPDSVVPVARVQGKQVVVEGKAQAR